MGTDQKGQQHDGAHGHHHHVLSYPAILTVGGALLFLTVLTVVAAHIDMGPVNFPVAFAIATIKAVLVGTIFMNLRYDRRENGMIFMTSFLFLAIFIVLTSTDLFFRGDVYVKPGALMAASSSVKSKLKNPWISTPELVAHGKELFLQNCVTCHGESGQGNGVAAAGLSPKPRNFTQAAGWDNGRLPSQVFKTLKEGVKNTGMASFATLPVDDRWALIQYVLSLGPEAPKESPETLAKIGYGPNGQIAEEKEEPSVPVDFALERMAQAETAVRPAMWQGEQKTEIQQEGDRTSAGPTSATAHTGDLIFQANCVSCHGDQGEGGRKVLAFGLFPRAVLTTRALTPSSEGLRSEESFSRTVREGLPGTEMPGFGQLTNPEVASLYSYVRSLRH